MNLTRPDICVSLGGIPYQELKALLPKFPLAEIRMDLLNLNNSEIQQIFASHHNLIATYRPINPEQDSSGVLINAINAGAAWVDIDIETPNEIAHRIISTAHSKQCKVIVSFHNFQATPTRTELLEIIKRAQSFSPELIKIACMANSYSDCSRVVSLYEDFTNILAFCMGPLGTITRIAAPVLGAPFTFASLPEKETAPGQLSYIQLNNLLNAIKPL